MRLLQTYLPIDRRFALSQHETLSDRAVGSVLFADISEFTSLTEALAQKLGPRRGAEELTSQLNLVFSALIEQVHRYHGAVIGFSGDAITCWFEEDNGRVATVCAFALQEVIADLFTSSTAFSLKVVVVSGQARRFLVGDSAVQLIDVLAGTLLDRMAAAQPLAQKGEVLVGGEVAAVLANESIIYEWRTAVSGERFALLRKGRSTAVADPWPLIEAIPTEKTKPWLLKPIYQKIMSGQGNFLAEMRPVVPLFIKFTSNIAFDQDNDASEKLDQYIRWVQSILVQYDGYMMHLTIGDKGSYISAAFGAPVTHEDDYRRAIKAALAIVKASEKFSFILASKLGISRGLMWTGNYGSPHRRTYGIMGTEVNLAAHLMENIEPNTICCTERITEAASSEYSFEALGVLQIKNIVRPVRYFKLTGHHVAFTSDRKISLVGRQKEQAQLEQFVDNLLNEQKSGTIIIEGEAGIGKSCLLAYVNEYVQNKMVSCFHGEADSINRNRVYHAWQSVIEQFFSLDVRSEGEAEREKLEWAETVRSVLLKTLPDAEELFCLLNPLLPFRYPESDLVKQMNPEARADSTHNLLVRLFAAEAEKSPIVLIMDDVHWLDSASWALLRQVQLNIRPLLLVLATRPFVDSAPPELFTQISAVPEAVHLSLTTLPDEDIDALIHRFFGVKSVPSSISQLILQKAEGHPFFSEELAAIMLESNLVHIENGVCTLSPGTQLDSIEFPDTIQGAVLSRLDRLSPHLQMTLKVASVIGRVFAYLLLEDIYPIVEERKYLPRNLNSLEQLKITLVESSAPELAYFFRHVLTREVAYNMMTFTQRQQLHGRVADWYEKSFATDLSPFYPLLAYHWQLAENDAKSIVYLEKAGEQALARFANGEAVRFFEQAIALSQKVQPTQTLALARWHRQIAEAYIRLSDLASSRIHLEASFSLLGQSIPHGRWQAITHIGKQIVIQILHRLRPQHYIDKVPKTNDPMARELALNGVAGFLYFYSQQSLWFWDTLRSLNLAEEVGLVDVKAKGYINLTLIAGLVGIHPIARLYQKLAWRMLSQTNNLETRAFVLLRDAVYRIPLGQKERALEQLEEGIALSKQLGDERQWSEHTATLGSYLYYMGRFSESRLVWQENYEASCQTDRIQSTAWGLFGQGMCLVQLGQPEEALRFFDDTQTYFDKMPDDLLASLIHGFKAWAWLKLGDLERGKREVDLHVLTAPGSPILYISLDAYCGAAELLFARWETNLQLSREERKTLKKLVKQISGLGKRMPFTSPSAGFYQGIWAWHEGREKEAFALWQGSIDAGIKFTRPYIMGRAYLEMGRHSPNDDMKRQHYLEKAIDIFDRLGCDYEHGRALAAIKRY